MKNVNLHINKSDINIANIAYFNLLKHPFCDKKVINKEIIIKSEVMSCINSLLLIKETCSFFHN